MTKDQAARASFFQDPEVFACNNLILPEVPGDQWNNGIIRIYQAAFIDYGLEFEFTCTRRGGEGQLGVYGVRQFLGQDTKGHSERIGVPTDRMKSVPLRCGTRRSRCSPQI